MKLTSREAAKHVGCVVQIVWMDACSLDEWTELGDISTDPLPTSSFGVLVGVGDKALTVAGTINGSAQVSGVIVVPYGMVEGFQVLLPKGSFLEA